MLTKQNAHGARTLGRAVRERYAGGQTDYSMEPVLLADHDGQPLGRIRPGDAVVFCCRRGEREIQLTEAFTDPDFSRFPRPSLGDLQFSILTLYHEKFKHLPVAFAPVRLADTLAATVSRAGLRQRHIAESEKFAHVTFFFNGGRNGPFEGEADECIPSPKGVPFDQVPQLSLAEVAARVIEGMREETDLIVTNFANGDVIGHTASREAKLKCASIVDRHLGHVVEEALARDYVVFITADHGNLEVMMHPDGTAHVSHTTNPVEFLIVDPRSGPVKTLPGGRLADVAPTILNVFGLKPPAAMTGTDLVPGHDWDGKRRLLLVILDGWGIGRPDESNPIFLSRTPVWDRLVCKYPHTALRAAGEDVGLQPDKAGNSEAGHLNLGAGRVVLQDDARLDLAMQDGSFESNEVFLRLMEHVKQNGTDLHLIGLLTAKSSHGSIEYPLALLRMAKKQGLQNAFLHVIFDGRSTQPGSAPALLEELETQLQIIGLGQVVTGMGRGLALDRDGNYDRTRRAYEALVTGAGEKFICD